MYIHSCLEFTFYLVLLECNVNALIGNKNVLIKRNFTELVSCKYFVDKTLFIKDFLEEVNYGVKTMTAPAGFGKSTLVDMLKTFLSNKHNATGAQTDYRSNPSYDVFCKEPLNICKHNEDFVQQHMGQYPVIHIRFSLMGDVFGLESLVDGMKDVIKASYDEHRYLLQDDVVWPASKLDKLGFVKRLMGDRALQESEVMDGWALLAETLHGYFAKKVIILLDDYEAQFGDLALRDGNKGIIISFVKGLYDNLFKQNTNLDKALITGEYIPEEFEVLPKLCMAHHVFLQDHVFAKYFGFNEEEINEIVVKNIKGEVERNETMEALKAYYDGDMVLGSNIKMYNCYSVVNYLLNENT
uniref:AAA-ATPase-like domain-containing protein n=1 Tax=Clastoptera arizonana TaxID=38151 RepID=A0A1B6CXQ2_9HEMI